MSVIPVPFNKRSYYVKSVLSKLKRENKFHIEENEEVIEIEDFFEELFKILDKERQGRKKKK
jgi:hypothetical protein